MLPKVVLDGVPGDPLEMESGEPQSTAAIEYYLCESLTNKFVNRSHKPVCASWT